MFSEDELLPLSALEHLEFCPRRCALIFVENLWEDNVFTIEGSIIHEQVTKATTESRGDIRIARAVRLRSLRLGISGVADVVEFHKVATEAGDEQNDAKKSTNINETLEEKKLKIAIELPGIEGLWKPFPVEYKRGRKRYELSYEVQLCAQALCLEEMLNVAVPCGALFYEKPHRRLEIIFDDRLRQRTEFLAAQLHQLFSEGKTPPPIYEKKCDFCSLLPLCLPKALGSSRSSSKYIEHIIQELEN